MKKFSGRKIKSDFLGNGVIDYYVSRPNKGGHTHNHCYNAAYTAAFGRHSLRRIPRDKRRNGCEYGKVSYKAELYT